MKATVSIPFNYMSVLCVKNGDLHLIYVDLQLAAMGSAHHEADGGDGTMGRLTQHLLSASQPAADRIRASGYSSSLDDLIEATDEATLEAFLVWRSVAHILRWSSDLADGRPAEDDPTQSRREICQMASYEYFPEMFPLARQLLPADERRDGGEEAVSMSSFPLPDWTENLHGNLLAKLPMSPNWADILAEAELIFSADKHGPDIVFSDSLLLTATSLLRGSDKSFLTKIVTLEKTWRPDARVNFLSDFLSRTQPNLEPVWLKNRLYSLYQAVRLRLAWLEQRVAASEFAAFRAQVAQERDYTELALGLTLDLVNSVKEDVEDQLNILHFGPMSLLEQFYLIVGSEACRIGDQTIAELVQTRLLCD